MGNKYEVNEQGLIRPVMLASDPASITEGFFYYNTVGKMYRFYDGTLWHNIDTDSQTLQQVLSLGNTATIDIELNAATFKVTGAPTGDVGLDFSGMTNDPAIKIAGSKALKINNSTEDTFKFNPNRSVIGNTWRMIDFGPDDANYGASIGFQNASSFKMAILTNAGNPILFMDGSKWQFNTLSKFSIMEVSDGLMDMSAMTSPTEIKMKMYQQGAQPALDADGKMALWWDTDDNKLRLIARNNGTTKTVEIS